MNIVMLLSVVDWCSENVELLCVGMLLGMLIGRNVCLCVKL